MNAQNAAPKTWSDLDPYLKAAHLKTAIVPATVDRIEFQTVHPRPGQEEIKPVMYFTGKQKGLILTATNQDFLRATFGDEITASYGKQITLRAVSKKIAGRMIDTVLVELPVK
jgi:alkanesulfonate monooxygenase SsuD/methylene tetrahydromethanopterin reductase-like flavin-dependent oxidoreductase (luciferase family)